MRRSRRALGASMAVLVIAVGALAGCAVDGHPGSSAAEVSAYSSEISASRDAEIRAHGAGFCSQVISSMGTMVNSYNGFLRRLNEIQNYEGVGALADRTRVTLNTGVERIREHLDENIPSDLSVPADVFLATTGRLTAAIEAKETTGLNPIADQWTDERFELLDACERYLPLPPQSSPPPLGPAAPSSSVSSPPATP